MIFGFNTDVKHGDTIYHVQSEAREGELLLQTQVFVRGRCVGKKATSYGPKPAEAPTGDAQKEQLLRNSIASCSTQSAKASWTKFSIIPSPKLGDGQRTRHAMAERRIGSCRSQPDHATARDRRRRSGGRRPVDVPFRPPRRRAVLYPGGGRLRRAQPKSRLKLSKPSCRIRRSWCRLTSTATPRPEVCPAQSGVDRKILRCCLRHPERSRSSGEARDLARSSPTATLRNSYAMKLQINGEEREFADSPAYFTLRLSWKPLA